MAPVTPKLDQSIAELILEMTTREMLDDVHLLDVDMESSAIPSNIGSEEGKQMINMRHAHTAKMTTKTVNNYWGARGVKKSRFSCQLGVIWHL